MSESANSAIEALILSTSTMKSQYGPLVGAIDEGTSSCRFIVFSASTGKLVAKHQIALSQSFPNEGWVEQDPMEILSVVNGTMEACVEKLKDQGIEPSDIVAVGLTNQRESTIVWDKLTGEPLYNSIVWSDARTTVTLDKILEVVPNKNKNYLAPLCGLPLSPYFSALKINWLMNNVPKVKQAIDEGRCCFGTVDTWVIWNLTGGKDGGKYVTDVSNASRTMLMNIETLQWDPMLCGFFTIPMDILPTICSSSEIYGYFAAGSLKGIPISGCIGDQNAALLGQNCLKPGLAKSTYGTGGFLLYNTGTHRVMSRQGLLTTVGYKLGDEPAIYALEGSVAVAGAAINWMRDNMGLISGVDEVETLADSHRHTGDVYFVPAFSGLYAPYWQPDARGILCGITEDTTKGHIVLAALEAICFQTCDILEAMRKDAGISLINLQVDGGMTANNHLMQIQADLCGIPVVRPQMVETTALGAAMAAGYAEGVKVWDLENSSSQFDTFTPKITDAGRKIRSSRYLGP
uniref:Probable glycerol kinase n=1 Tax=Cacopsylla melanoneura TaxID=428564 RepID=A0A8D8ZJ29_9HEMI